MISPAGRQVDVGFSAYADDTRKLVVHRQRMPLIKREREFSEILDAELAKVSLAQNVTKKEIVPHVTGRGKLAFLQFLFTSQP